MIADALAEHRRCSRCRPWRWPSLIGIPLGVAWSRRPGGRLDDVIAFISVGFVSAPSFVVSIFLLLVFAVLAGWFPVLGAGEAAISRDQLQHLVLPAMALASGWIGYIARLLRSSLLEVLGEPHIRTMRAYGVPEWKVLFKYAFKPACIPTLAIIGMGVGELLGGAVFAEVDLRPARARLPDLHGDRHAQLSRGAGRGAGRGRAVRAHQSDGRVRLCGDRSAHPEPHARRGPSMRAALAIVRPLTATRAGASASPRSRCWSRSPSSRRCSRRTIPTPSRRRSACRAPRSPTGSAPIISAAISTAGSSTAPASRSASRFRSSPFRWRSD